MGAMFLAIATALCLIGVQGEDSPVVRLPEGSIVGSELVTFRKHVKYYSYMGVPYAKPPLGDLRFEAPQPNPGWEGILETKKFSKMCYQTGVDNIHETEDCLYLNVFTPVKPGSYANLTVMVDIHGGEFIRGSAATGDRKPQFLMEAGVIVVNLNYRLGPFGFLSSLDKEISGNMGLKDQLLALKWVNRNIHLFGGDPAKVTIMGQSAGGASVTYHILSKRSAGLFRAAIANSAAAICSWANQRHPLDVAYGIANEIDKSFSRKNTTQELKLFLKSVDAAVISKTEDKYQKFAPVIEMDHEEAFVTEAMYESVSQGKINKVPLLMGHTSEECLTLISNMKNAALMARRYDRNVSLLVDENMEIYDAELAQKVGMKIKQIYVENGTFEAQIGKLVQFMSDKRYIRATQRYAELQSQYTDVYFYQFSYHGALGNNNLYLQGLGRVIHSEDMRYLWTYIDSFQRYDEADEATVDRYVTLLTNFAKYLNPTPTEDPLFQNLLWPRMSTNGFYYLDIDHNLTLRKNPREFSYEKMVNIYNSYGKKPLITF